MKYLTIQLLSSLNEKHWDQRTRIAHSNGRYALGFRPVLFKCGPPSLIKQIFKRHSYVYVTPGNLL